MNTPAVPARVLERAAHLFVTRGYHEISMREIAEAVGTSKAGLYYHFKDKEDLFLAILTANLSRIELLIQEARNAGSDARTQVEEMIRAIFAQAPEQRAIIRLASQEMAHLSAHAREEFDQLYYKKFIGQVEAILQGGINRGEFRPLNTHLATWALLGMMYPFFYPAHEQDLGISEDAIQVMLTIFFEGFCS